MHRQHRSFRQHLQVTIGDDGGDLDDAIRVGIQARHFQIDPDEVVGGFHTQDPVN
jgi:hypothetical protein